MGRFRRLKLIHQQLLFTKTEEMLDIEALDIGLVNFQEA